jgi:hypothetical protein
MGDWKAKLEVRMLVLALQVSLWPREKSQLCMNAN